MSVETAEMLLRKCIRISELTEEQNVEIRWTSMAGEEMAVGYFGYDQHEVLVKFLGRDEVFNGTEAMRLHEVGITE